MTRLNLNSLATASLFALLLSWQTAQACRTDRVVIMRSTGFGLSLGSGSSSFTGGLSRRVEIPLRVNGKKGCMTQKSALDFEAKTNRRGEFKGEFNIYPPQVSFEKINGRVETFLKIDNNGQNARDFLNLSLVSFTCSGESVIAVEGFEGTVRDASKIHELSVSVSQVLATGMAARLLSERRQQQFKVYGKTHALPKSLEKEFLALLDKAENLSLEDIEAEEVSRPAILLSTSLATGAMDLDASFSTLVSTKYGCSKNFRSLMDRYHVENVKNQLKNLPLKSKVSSKKIQLRWK